MFLKKDITKCENFDPWLRANTGLSDIFSKLGSRQQDNASYQTLTLGIAVYYILNNFELS